MQPTLKRPAHKHDDEADSAPTGADRIGRGNGTVRRGGLMLRMVSRLAIIAVAAAGVVATGAPASAESQQSPQLIAVHGSPPDRVTLSRHTAR